MSVVAYVITDACRDHVEAFCVAVCPVDCIHPAAGEPGHDEARQLYIDPDACTDCDACIDECPWGAIHPAGELPAQHAAAAERNAAWYRGPGAAFRSTA
ncbi:MAG: 4Fe-4S dicluster domain-containing protein [Solirubrobacteraceae bacterium]|nr:4Fe-4S dicluster domain-containing protein [Solirubrobacteraceae bacterium]